MFYEAELAFNEGANDGFWRFQLRGKNGRWIKMGGLCSFEYRIPGDKKVYKAYGTFQGNRSRGASVVRVGKGQSLSPGDYEIDSRFIEGVKAIIRSKEVIASEAKAAKGPKKIDEAVGKEAESKQVVSSTVGDLEIGDIVQQSTAEALYGRIASVNHDGDKTKLNVEWSDGSSFDMELPKDQKIKVWNRDDVVEPEAVAAPKSRFTPPTDPAEIESLRVRAEEQKARVAEANKEREARLEAKAKQEAEAAEDYRMSHRPPNREDTAEEGVAASLDKIDQVFPSDILDPAKQNIYRTGDAKADKETFDVINSIKGNPDAEVTIYRGVPGDAGDEISAGDWVTLSPAYAQQHIDSNVPGGKVISMKVKASDLFTNADSINEWGYDPKTETVDAPKEDRPATLSASQIVDQFRLWDAEAYGISNQTFLEAKAREVSEPTYLDADGNEKKNPQYGLEQDIIENGIQKPIEAELDGKGRPVLLEGHTRLAIMLKNSPDAEIPIKWVDSDEPESVDAPSVEKEEAKSLLADMDGEQALGVIRSVAAKVAEEDGRFPVARSAEDVEAGAKRQYADVFESLKKEYPDLVSQFKDYDEFWEYSKKSLAVSTSTRYADSVGEIPPLMRAANLTYARDVLGLDPDGMISFYRNSINNNTDIAKASAGYASLDKNMAFNYNSNKGNEGANGRYEIKAKPGEVLGMLGYSDAVDEHGVVIGPDVTAIPGRVKRLGDLGWTPVNPLMDPELTSTGSGGGSRFRFFSTASTFEFPVLDANPFAAGEKDKWSDFYAANGLEQGAIPGKYDELYGEGAYERDFPGSSGVPRYDIARDLFTEKDGQFALDPIKFDSTFKGSEYDLKGRAGDGRDKALKFFEAVQQLSGDRFMTLRGGEKSEPESVDAPNVAEDEEELGGSDGWEPVGDIALGRGESEWLDSKLNSDLFSMPESDSRHTDADLFSDEQLAHIEDYTGTGFRETNRALRDGENLSSVEQAKVSNLDAAIEELGEVTEPGLVVYRGHRLRSNVGDDLSQWVEDLAPGDVISDPAFTSTSSDPVIAYHEFGPGIGVKKGSEVGSTEQFNYSTSFWKIDTPEGTKALPLPRSTGITDENEVLLPRNAEMKITAIRKVPQMDADGNETGHFNYFIEAELLPQSIEAEPKSEPVAAPKEVTKQGPALLSGKANVTEFWKTDKKNYELKAEVADNIRNSMLEAGITQEEMDALFDDLATGDTDKNVDKLELGEWEGAIDASGIGIFLNGSTVPVSLTKGLFQVGSVDITQFSAAGDKTLTMEEARALLAQMNEENEGGDDEYYARMDLFVDSYQAKKDAVTLLVSAWATTSNDDSALSLAIQDIAKETFEMGMAAEWTKSRSAETEVRTKELKKKYKAIMAAFLNAQYEATQRYFRDRGITEVEVYRGMYGVEASKKPPVGGGDVEVQLRPLSSWSTSQDIADEFAEGKDAVLYKAVLPIETILALPFTGVGCLSEQELVILGGLFEAFGERLN